MATGCNLRRPDRMLRFVLGVGMGIAGILVNEHPYLGRILGIVGAIVILKVAWGT